MPFDLIDDEKIDEKSNEIEVRDTEGLEEKNA